MRKLFFAFSLFALFASTSSAQNPDLVLNPGSSYVDVGRGISWGSGFNRTYVIVPNSPNASVCIYVVNNNPTNAHAFTVATFQSADSQVTDFSNNQGRFNSVPLIGMPASVPAATMVSGFTQSTAAAKVAIKFSGAIAQGGAPDTADVFLVQTTSGTCGSASSVPMVQGTSAPGTTGTGNPVLIGGLDTSNFAQFYRFAQFNSGASNVNGFPIGGVNSGNGANYSNHRLPGGSQDGPLGVSLFAVDGGLSTSSRQISKAVSGTQNCGTQAGCAGIFTADSGFVSILNGFPTSATVQFSLWSTISAQNGVVESCSITIFGVNTAGASPTLDVFLQDSGDGVNWNDRIHFTQITTGTGRFTAGIAGGSANKTVAALTSGSIAQGTIVSGPLDINGRLNFVIGGTSPQYTLSYFANCK